jgi:hypothetical protein
MFELTSADTTADPEFISAPRNKYEVAIDADASTASADGAAARPNVAIVVAAIKVLLKVFIVCFNLKVKFIFR